MGLLDTLSAELESSVIDELSIKMDYEKQDEADNGELDMYEAFAVSKTPLVIGFAAITPDGDYYVSAGEDSSLRIVMRRADASLWNNVEIQKEKRSNLLGIDIDAMVKEVDRANKIVYVEAVKRTSNLRREQIAAELAELFNAAEASGSAMCVPVNATVVGVYDRYVVLNIARAGVMARVGIANWTKYFVRNLRNVVRRGDTVKINITGKASMRTVRGVQAWEAEHQSYTRDPWALIDEKRVGKDSVVVVECTESNFAMNRWWGRPVDSSVLPQNMELLGDMKSGEMAVRPEVGKSYKCTVIYVNPSKRELKVRPYQELLADRNKFGVSVKKN